MRKILPIILGLLAFGGVAYAQSQGIQQLNQWKTTNGAYLQPINNSYGLKVPGLATSTTGCLEVLVGGWVHSVTGLPCGTGGGGSFSWTPTTNFAALTNATG